MPNPLIISPPAGGLTLTTPTSVLTITPGSAVSIGLPGLPGPPGPPGPPGSGAAVEIELTNVASGSYPHDFTYPPLVRFVLPDGSSAQAGVEYVDDATIYVEFPAPFTGTMILS